MKIAIGKADGKQVYLDIPRLLATRLLIQANSGKGKSWLIRLLAERLFGKVQVIIIDPEGEFASLREKFDYVLVGKGGETPADTRSAALLAHRLLQLKVSAVCDLYEMKPAARHTWVKLFVEALIDSPKELWHPVVIVVDEAHSFVPEKGAGESEASEAMIALSTRGRKRGFCAVFATQRLGKLRKDAAAELVNVLIGGTFIDIDRKRAADTLGVYGKDTHDFFNEVRLLERGHFFALGPAISTERILVEVGSVETTHPEAGSAKHAAEPPPTPKEIAKLLPKLSDLPKAAEEQAKTVAELKTEIRSLKAQLRAQPTGKPVEVKVVDQKAIDRAVQNACKKMGAGQAALQAAVKRQWAVLKDLAERAAKGASLEIPNLPQLPQFTVTLPQMPTIHASEVTMPSALPVRARPSTPPAENNGDLSGPEQRILNAIAWMESIGVTEPQQPAIAFLAGYTYGAGAFNNPRGKLNMQGLVRYVGGGRIALSEEGRAKAKAPESPLTTEEMHRHVLEILPGPERKLLKALLDIYPKDISRDELAELVQYAPGSGAFNNPCGRLRTLELIDSPVKGRVIAKNFLFVD